MIAVRSVGCRATQGFLEIGGFRLPCALGRSGLKAMKREGDGATPLGTFRLQRVLWRADRGIRPRTRLPAAPIRPDDGWCDETADRNYNRNVRHPYPTSAERLWREDRLYDVVVVLDHNQRPRIKGRGSAVFMHVARAGLAPTAGCIALEARGLRLLLEHVGRSARVIVGGGPKTIA